MKRSILALVVLLLVTVSTSFAQVTAVPQRMNFQGRLAKPDGTPVADGTYSVRFSLWNVASGGTQNPNETWNQTINPVTVRNGVFSVQLSGFPANTFNINLWLEIKIGSNPALTPRQQLVTVPYAMKADLALTVPDGSITNLKIAPGTLTADRFAPNIFNPLAWLLGGNSGTNSTHFLGTTDNQPLNLRVNNRRAMRYQYAEDTGSQYRSINVLGGSEINSISAGVIGATIAGGGYDSFIDADFPNRATANFATVGGGYSNTSAFLAVVGGGLGNTGSGTFSTVGGGYVNVASGVSSVIAGGDTNTASGNYSAVGGGFSQFASGIWSTIAGGNNNTANNNYAAVGGGYSNIAGGLYSFVGGGYGNNTSNSYSTVGGGYSNNAVASSATVSGGYQNTASDNYAAVAGGRENTASGSYSIVAGGVQNTALGSLSFAAGQRAKANHDGAFVWADSTPVDFASTAFKQFSVRASGGVRIFTNSALTTGVTLTAGDSTWNSVSDRNAKWNFRDVDSLDVLDKLIAMPLTTWNYKSRDDIRHMGVMAQDFYAAFRLGTDDKHISTVDADGVAFAAIQGLNKKLEAQNAELKKDNAKVKGEVSDLKAKNAELEARLNALAEAVRQLQNDRR